MGVRQVEHLAKVSKVTERGVKSSTKIPEGKRIERERVRKDRESRSGAHCKCKQSAREGLPNRCQMLEKDSKK